MMPLSDLFVHVSVLVADALKATVVSLPRRPGPKPVCTAAEILTVALVRHLLGRPSAAGFLEEVRQNWSHDFPKLPGQSAFPRRVRWLWGAFEERRADRGNTLPEETWPQGDTTALPVKHPRRVRGPDRWRGPGGLVAGLGGDAAHRAWFSGVRVARRTGETVHRTVSRAASGQGRGHCPVTRPVDASPVDERPVAAERLERARGGPKALRLDRGFRGQRWVKERAEAGIAVVFMPGRQERRSLSRDVLRPIARLRKRIETTTAEWTEPLGRARHGSKTFWGCVPGLRLRSWPIPCACSRLSNSHNAPEETSSLLVSPEPPADCFAGPVEHLTVVLTPGRTARRLLPAAVRRPVAGRRNRSETTIGELTERRGLARHGARTFWGRLPRTAATILAQTLLRLRLV